MNHRWGYKNNLEAIFNFRQVPYVERNLIDLDDRADLETTYADPDELLPKNEILRKKVTKEDAK